VPDEEEEEEVPPSQRRRTILYLLPLSQEIEAAGSPKCRYLSTLLNVTSHNTVIFIINFTPQFQNP